MRHSTWITAAFLISSAGALGADGSAVTDRCRQEGERFTEEGVIGRDCFGAFMTSGAYGAVAVTDNGKFLVLGAGNLVFVQEKSAQGAFTVNVLSGPNSGLAEIGALDIDERNRELVLTDGGDKPGFVVFPFPRHGNLVPIRSVRTAGVKGITSVAVDPAGDEIAALVRGEGKVRIFRRLADERRHTPEHSVAVLREISGLQSPSALAFDRRAGELLVLEPDRSEILVFGPGASGEAGPARTIPVPAAAAAAAKRISVGGDGGIRITLDGAAYVDIPSGGGPARSPASASTLFSLFFGN